MNEPGDGSHSGGLRQQRRHPKAANGRRHHTIRQQSEQKQTPQQPHDPAIISARIASPTTVPAPQPISFEDKIALALGGSNWQQLQQNSPRYPNCSVVVQPQSFTNLPEQVQVAEDEADPTDQGPVFTAKQMKKKAKFDSRVAQHAGDVLDTIEVEGVKGVAEEVLWDRDPELLCSYNWQASTDDTNTIFVPGEPGKWRPPVLPFTLDPDTGYQYADYNYARKPRTPYDPMFEALRIMNPDYQFMDVDVLADRNNLRVLLEFVQGKANGPFRLDLYTIFNTLIIVRNEAKWWKHSNGESYGCNFEAFFTRSANEMEDATSHYRAIRYSMGPLSVVCRFEADAYDDGAGPDDLAETQTPAVSGGLAQRPSFKYSTPIRVLQKGHIVPTPQMVELKTKAIKKDEFGRDVSGLVQCQDQLWFGRTSLLYTGPYESGTGLVSRVKYENAADRVKKWEAKNQDSLQKLVGLLLQLKTIMKREKRPNHSVIIVREGKAGPLSVRSMESMNRAVGKEAFDKHWRRTPTQSKFQRGGFRGPGRGQVQNPGGGGFRAFSAEHGAHISQVDPATDMRGGGQTRGRRGAYRGRGGMPPA